MDNTRKLDYVFFTVREFAYKIFETVVNDFKDMLMKSCPEDKRICIFTFDHDDSHDTTEASVRGHVQLEYLTINPDAKSVSTQLCVGIVLMESLTSDKWYLIVDIPATRNHFEYEFWIEHDDNDTVDEKTAYSFRGTTRSNALSHDMTDYQGYKYYKQFLYESIQSIVGNSHVAVRTNPDDPDAFVYR